MQSVAGQDFFAGNWLWFTVTVTMMVFNDVAVHSVQTVAFTVMLLGLVLR